jgi:MFS family permease
VLIPPYGSIRTIIIAIIIYMAGMTLLASSFNFYMIMLGRIITGVGVGLGFTSGALYGVEIAPAKDRGAVTSFIELAINAGLLSGYLSALALYSLPSEYNWRLMMALPVAPSLWLLYHLRSLPESPRWLVSKAKDQEAREMLHATCHEEEVEATLQDIQEVRF